MKSILLQKSFFVGKSTIASTASFYDFLSEEHLNKKAFVCNGTACLCANTQERVKITLTQAFTEEEIGENKLVLAAAMKIAASK